jgi:hypothetical protein
MVYHAVTSPDRSDGAGLARRRDSLKQTGLERVPEPAPQVFRSHVVPPFVFRRTYASHGARETPRVPSLEGVSWVRKRYEWAPARISRR